MKLYIGKSNFLITNNVLDLKIVELNKLLDLKIRPWNNSIKGIDGYAWFITSKNFLEFKIKRKHWNIETKIFPLKEWSTTIVEKINVMLLQSPLSPHSVLINEWLR